jgi:hypothetical protein
VEVPAPITIRTLCNAAQVKIPAAAILRGLFDEHSAVCESLARRPDQQPLSAISASIGKLQTRQGRALVGRV